MAWQITHSYTQICVYMLGNWLYTVWKLLKAFWNKLQSKIWHHSVYHNTIPKVGGVFVWAWPSGRDAQIMSSFRKPQHKHRSKRNLGKFRCVETFKQMWYLNISAVWVFCSAFYSLKCICRIKLVLYLWLTNCIHAASILWGITGRTDNYCTCFCVVLSEGFHKVEINKPIIWIRLSICLSICPALQDRRDPFSASEFQIRHEKGRKYCNGFSCCDGKLCGLSLKCAEFLLIGLV